MPEYEIGYVDTIVLKKYRGTEEEFKNFVDTFYEQTKNCSLNFDAVLVYSGKKMDPVLPVLEFLVDHYRIVMIAKKEKDRPIIVYEPVFH